VAVIRHHRDLIAMRRIAVPMIGGMISSTILTLVVIPAVYVIKGWRLSEVPLHRTRDRGVEEPGRLVDQKS
jgi:Cu(I)/Ag(I) efflux system membrane protein CusA/SilA